MAKMSRFVKWLMEEVKPTGNRMGDLIEDIRSDPELPPGMRGPSALALYLRACHACDGAIDAAQDLADVWRQHEFRRSSAKPQGGGAQHARP